VATRQQNRSRTHTRTLLPLSSRVHCFGPYETSALQADSSLSKTDRQCSSTRALMIDKDRFAAISKIQTQLESKREHQLTLQSLRYAISKIQTQLESKREHQLTLQSLRYAISKIQTQLESKREHQLTLQSLR
jgi:hypothetical protein